jgi:hypothetical protein
MPTDVGLLTAVALALLDRHLVPAAIVGATE